MAVKGYGGAFDFTMLVTLHNGIGTLALWAFHHIAYAGDGKALNRRLMGHGYHFSAVIGRVV